MQRRNAVERAGAGQVLGLISRQSSALTRSLMRKLRPTTPEGVDGKLFHLWDLLNHAVDFLAIGTLLKASSRSCR